MGYKGYGLPLNEMISEGNVGLMQAVKKFEPEKGFRLATYAMWWIKASIQEYILRSWSLVKIEISDELLKEDKSIIEDLIIAAHNNAKLQLKSKTSEEISKATGGLGIPGFKWPL